MNLDELKTLYASVMAMEPGLFTRHVKFMLRQWDGMDGCWTDCFDAPVDLEPALREWARKTENGTKRIRFDEIDYYRVFPANTKMVWDGGEGREMFR